MGFSGYICKIFYIKIGTKFFTLLCVLGSIKMKGLLSLALAGTSLPFARAWTLPLATPSTPRAHSAVATLSAYPSYDGALAATIKGTIVVKDEDVGISLFGTIGGAESSVTGGIHIHTGVSCEDTGEQLFYHTCEIFGYSSTHFSSSYHYNFPSTDKPGGHYYPNMETDPWNAYTTYTTDEAGGASVYLALSSFSLGGTNPVAGRVVVMHNGDGDRIACGVLESTPGEIVQLGTCKINLRLTPSCDISSLSQRSLRSLNRPGVRGWQPAHRHFPRDQHGKQQEGRHQDSRHSRGGEFSSQWRGARAPLVSFASPLFIIFRSFPHFLLPLLSRRRHR